MNGVCKALAVFGSLAVVAPARPALAQSSVAFAPTIGTIPDGVTLSVTPVVSADRRYVRLTNLNPTFIAFDRFDTFTVPAAVSGGGLGLGGGGLGGLGGGLGGGGGFNSVGLGGTGALSGFADPRPPSSFALAAPEVPETTAKATRGRRPAPGKRPPALVRTSPRRRGR